VISVEEKSQRMDCGREKGGFLYAETEGSKARLLGKEAKNRRVRFFLSGLWKARIWIDAARARDNGGVSQRVWMKKVDQKRQRQQRAQYSTRNFHVFAAGHSLERQE